MFGQLLAWHRRRLSLTQEELADRAGLSDRTVRSLEAGRGRSPRPVSVRLLADALGLADPYRTEFFAAARPGSSPDSDTRPAQLPAPPHRFVGRRDALAELDALGRVEAGNTVVLSAVEGLAGVGKTALALRWAAAARDAFPDGQLYIDLRGFSGETPVRPLDGLTRLLRALRVPPGEIPAVVDEAAARFRTAVADRRMLIVLDDAVDAEQVRPLLPGPSRCVVVVTSRSRLSGLTAIEGAHRITLLPLSPDEAVAVLRAFVGDDRVDREPAAAAAVAAVCGHLPLALRIAAAGLADRPRRRIADYLQEARQAGLAALSVPDDPRHGVEVAFTVSYVRLPAAAARMFRLLSLAPGPTVGVDAAAALAGVTADRALPLTQSLVDAHLLEEPRPGRYAMHDLIAQYARNRLAADEPAHGRAAAVTRLLDWFLTALLAAYDLLSLGRRQVSIPAPDPAGALPFTGRRDAALAFLDAERASFADFLAFAGAEGAHDRAWQTACLLGPYFHLRGDSPESLAVYLAGLRWAATTGDALAQGTLHNNAGIAYATMRHLPEATEQMNLAVAAWQSAGRVDAEARTLANVGTMYHLQRRFAESREASMRALRLFDAAGEAHRTGPLLNNLGGTLAELGETGAALGYLERSLAVHRATGNVSGEADALSTLGRLHLATGALDEALAAQHAALGAARAADYRVALGAAFAGIGHVHRARGDLVAAAEHLRRAADSHHDVDNRAAEAEIRRELADLYTAQGQEEAARSERETAAALDRR